jgi:hypothetical protein
LAQEDIESGKQLGIENLHKMREELEKALRAYRTAHTKAVKRLYRHYPSNLSGEDGFFKTSNKPELDSRPNEEVFLIYFFCFNLEEFAREQISLIEAFHGIQMEEARLEEESQAYRERFGDWATLVRAVDVFGCFVSSRSQHGQTHRWKTLSARLGTAGRLRYSSKAILTVIFSATHAILESILRLALPSHRRPSGHQP